MLKAAITKDAFTALPDAVKEHYKPASGNDAEYLLDIEGEPAGFVPKGRLDEFRENNISLKRTVETLTADKARVEGQLTELREKTKDIGNVEALVETKIKQFREDKERELAEIKKNLEKANGDLNKAVLDSGLARVASELGIRKEAVTDFITRGKGTFTVKDGVPVALDPTNNQVLLGKDGTTPLSMQEWGGRLKEQAPHLFEPSKGAGAGGNGGQNNGSGGANPFKVEGANQPNLTAISKLVKENRAEAIRLATEAGADLKKYGLDK